MKEIHLVFHPSPSFGHSFCSKRGHHPLFFHDTSREHLFLFQLENELSETQILYICVTNFLSFPILHFSNVVSTFNAKLISHYFISPKLETDFHFSEKGFGLFYEMNSSNIFFHKFS